MIGILYSQELLGRLMRGKRSFEQPVLYLKAAQETGEEVIFFSLSDIQWRKGTVRGWNGSAPIKMERPLPPVIINRMRTNQQHVKRRIQWLKQRGAMIFNEHNVISKLEIHQILAQNDKLLPYLPVTQSVSRHSVKDLLEQNTCLFLKPSTASVGNGIIRVRKVRDGAIAEINVLGRTKRRKVGIDQMIRIVRKQKRNYLVQQGIPLMAYQNKAVDFRVSVQKNDKGVWQVTGIVGKIARKGAIVTNLHCGGQSLKATQLFQHWGWDGNKIERKINELGINIAKELDKQLPHIADLGLDIALDEQQHPWLIEANFRDLRITFREAGEKEKWRATFATPIRYASYLLKDSSRN